MWKTGAQFPLPLPTDANGDAEGTLAEVELLPVPPRQENKQIPGTQQGQLCQNHQILLYFSSHLARSQHREGCKHSTETPQGFSFLTLYYDLQSLDSMLGSGGPWETFQMCMDDQRDRKAEGRSFLFPCSSPFHSHMHSSRLQSSSLQDLKIADPDPFPKSAHTPMQLREVT